MPTFYLATYESPNFHFSALGASEAEAESALIAGLRRHGEQCELPADWFYTEDIIVNPLQLGLAYRDGDLELPPL